MWQFQSRILMFCILLMKTLFLLKSMVLVYEYFTFKEKEILMISTLFFFTSQYFFIIKTF